MAGHSLTENEKTSVINECQKQLLWLDAHPDATKSELEQRLQDAKNVCQPAMMKLHGAAGGPSARPDSPEGPKVEEVD